VARISYPHPSVHILSGDLTQHKRTLAPFKSLVYGLRRYDLDRCIAVATSSAEDPATADAASQNVVGYMSHKSKVYLADVHDHVEYILSSMDTFAGISENLINYTFNVCIHSALNGVVIDRPVASDGKLSNESSNVSGVA
jgi:hypothetical protein